MGYKPTHDFQTRAVTPPLYHGEALPDKGWSAAGGGLGVSGVQVGGEGVGGVPEGCLQQLHGRSIEGGKRGHGVPEAVQGDGRGDRG